MAKSQASVPSMPKEIEGDESSSNPVFGLDHNSLEDSVLQQEEIEERMEHLSVTPSASAAVAAKSAAAAAARSVTSSGSSNEEFEDARESLSICTGLDVDSGGGISPVKDDDDDRAFPETEPDQPDEEGDEEESGQEQQQQQQRNRPELVLNSDEWRLQAKHLFILSDAGKPIYARHGDEDELSTLTALIQAHVAFVEDMDDHIRAIHVSGDCSIVFLNKGPLILVGVTHGMETVTQMVVQLTYMYHQILSVLTLSQLTRIFEQRKNYDLRIMIRGCERLLDSLANAMDADPSFMLSAVRVLELAQTTRDAVSNTISRGCAKIRNVVFAILIIENRLIALVRKKEYFIHPADLHLILNLVNSTESFKHSESWTPVCLPKFNSSGFLHGHVSYLTDDCDACLLMLTTERDIFFELSEAKHKIVADLEKSGSISAIRESALKCKFSPVDLGFPTEMVHFLYKSKTTAQFVGSEIYPGPYANDAVAQNRIHNLYLYAQSKTHASGRNAKFVYHTGKYENLAGWATQAFELYAIFDPLTSKSRAVAALNKVTKWAKKEENSLFILSAPTFN